MAKYHSTFEHGNSYHVYNRGNSYADIFVEERNYDLFLSMKKKYLLQVADIYAYCLMKNHFHLLLRIKNTQEIEDEKLRVKPYLAFAYMFNAYAKTFNKTYNRRGSLFQEHLKKEVISNDEYLRQAVRYIHLNPVKHRFSDTVADYPHSSFNAYLSDKKTLLKRDDVLKFFGGLENFKLCHNFEKEDLSIEI
jgi:REP element-mobilizing transposase RayT